MTETAEEAMGMACIEEYIIEGRSTLSPETWQFIGYTDDQGARLNPCPTLEKALTTVAQMKEALSTGQHVWDELRIVRKFTYTQVALVTQARVKSTIVRV